MAKQQPRRRDSNRRRPVAPALDRVVAIVDESVANIVVTHIVRKRQRRGPAKAGVGVLSDPPILVFSLSIGKDS